jgi:hypothetical protein
VYSALAAAILALHLLFILWVVFGATVTRRRPVLRCLHLGSMIWGMLIEILPWNCPLTWAENWLEAGAGVTPYQGGFLLHKWPRQRPDRLRVLLRACPIAASIFRATHGLGSRRPDAIPPFT